MNFMKECFHHGKPIAALGNGEKLLKTARLPAAGREQGVFKGDTGAIADFVEAIKKHRSIIATSTTFRPDVASSLQGRHA